MTPIQVIAELTETLQALPKADKVNVNADFSRCANDTVIDFTIIYNQHDRWNYDKAEVKITWTYGDLAIFIPNAGLMLPDEMTCKAIMAKVRGCYPDLFAK